jgi:transcriptional regulator with XRE-family HTH domain
MGKSYNTINEYSRNVRQPSLEGLYIIAEILNVEVKDLLIERKINEQLNRQPKVLPQRNVPIQ